MFIISFDHRSVMSDIPAFLSMTLHNPSHSSSA